MEEDERVVGAGPGRTGPAGPSNSTNPTLINPQTQANGQAGQVRPPPMAFNPAALPGHIQEQLRRQVVQQQQMQQQQMQHLQQQQPMPRPSIPMPMAMMRPPMMAMPFQQPMMTMPFQQQQPQAMAYQQQNQLQNQPQQQPQRRIQIPPTRLTALAQVLPFRPNIDEPSFMLSLSQFLSCIGLPLRKPPAIHGRQISLLQLLSTVLAFGGYQRVSESRRWPAVGASIGFAPGNMEVLTTLHSTYVTLLLAYEQYMIAGLPAESVNWPPGVAKLFESQANSGGTMPRLMSTNQPAHHQQHQPLPNRQQQPQQQVATSSPQTPAPNPSSSSSALDAISTAQWRNVHTIRDPFIVLHRGRHAFREVCLMMESGLGHLERHALNQLQVLILEPGCPTPDAESIGKIVPLLFRLASKKSQIDCAARTVYQLSREHSQRHHQIFGEEVHDGASQVVSNVLRAMLGRSDAKDAVIKTLSRDASLVARLHHWASSSSSSYEVRKNALIVLSELTPGCICLCDSLPLLKALSLDLEELSGLLLSSTHRQLLSWEHIPSGVESLKKTIVSMIQTSATVFRLVPPLASVELDVLYRILLQHALCEQTPDQIVLLGIMNHLACTMRSFLQPISKLTRLTNLLLCDPEFVASEEAPKWIQKILHNSSFGLPDGGYLEMLMLGIEVSIACLEPEGVKTLVEESSLVQVLLETVVALRRFWEIPECPSPIKFERHIPATHGPNGRPTSKSTVQLTERSPLTWQAITSATSHHYRLFLSALTALYKLVQAEPSAMQEHLEKHLSMLSGWTCGEELGGRLSREVLLEAGELREVYARLLQCAMGMS